MIYISLIYAFAIIFLAGRLLLGFKLFGLEDEPSMIKPTLYFFAGTGVIGLYMFLLSMMHIRFGLSTVSLPFIIYFLLNIRSVIIIKMPMIKREWIKPSIMLISFLVLGLLCIALFLDGLVSPIFSKDAFAMWFMKAKILYFEGRIPFEIFKLPLYSYSSPEYPLLVPLNLAWISVCLREWNDILLRMFFIVQYILFIPFLYASLRRYTNRNMSALGCLLLLANRHVLTYAANGYLDLLLGMFTLISTVYFVRWMEEKNFGHLLLSAIFIGFSAFTKNEGIALFLGLSATLALFMAFSYKKIGYRTALNGFLMFMAVAALIFAPYQAVSASYHISSHMIKSHNIFISTMENIGRAPEIAGHFFFQLYLNTYSWQYFWIIITILLVAGRRKMTRSNMGYVFIFLVISLALYFEVYMLTVANNLTSSFHRLLIGLAPVSVFLAFSIAPGDEEK